MKPNSNNKNIFMDMLRKISAMSLIYTILIICLPFGNRVNAQVSDPVSFSGGKAVKFSAGAGSQKFSPELKDAVNEVLRKKGGANSQTGNNTVLSQQQGTPYLFANVEFMTLQAREAVFSSAKTSKISGISVVTVVDRFADIFIATDAAADQLAQTPGIVYMDGFRRVVAPPPPPVSVSKSGAKAVPDQIVRNGFQGLRGKNVIIAVVDTGVDFRHPDFITYDAAGNPTSRFLYLWDMGTNYKSGRGTAAPFQYPNKAPIGTVYTQAQLTNELRAATPTIPATDLDGHGTACASIAAGNGNADMSASGLKRSDVVGVAPDALIIGVSLDTTKEGSLGGAHMINAIAEWLDKVAGAKPLVISNSWGGHYTGHDGQTIAERQLNVRFSPDKKGRAILFAAGNEGEDNFHGTLNFSGESQPGLVGWSTASTYMKAYFNTDDLKDISFQTGANTTMTLSSVIVNPITKQAEATFKVAQGIGTAKFFTTSGKTLKADFYFPPFSQSMFNSAVQNRQGLVGSPGTTENAITVGSYDWNDNFHTGGSASILKIYCADGNPAMKVGAISCYSSPGPTRDGRMKPEIASPGQWYASSAAMNNGTPVAEARFLDTTGKYVIMNGTSAATPYTSGIVALMFEKKPTLTSGEIKNLLKTNATKDVMTGMNPGTAWGAGKLDVNAVARIMAAIK